ncbi:DUF4123 domain-containing protein [Deefgea rivuli]|uniref:DUF4123 domain-containing protein n=1 Tax=Deefgea rivuli TaxID=400948 RepID=UPI0004843525|nr:DUF4123 domain-containing protein [Deefgea rivuli]
MKIQAVLAHATPEQCIDVLNQQLQQIDCVYVDAIIDQAQLDGRQKRQLLKHPELRAHSVLLTDSAHADAADMGPILLRYVASTSSLELLINSQFESKNLLVLVGTGDFFELEARLKISLHAEWNKGVTKGVLRYYDPRVITAVAHCLMPNCQEFLFGCAETWYWIGRDQQLMSLSESSGRVRHDLLAISLDEEQVQYLSAWHLAEVWRLDEALIPVDVGLQSQEEMMAKLVQAHLSADRAQLWQLEARREHIYQQLKDLA